MSTNKTPFFLNFPKIYENKDFLKISSKILFKKYTFEENSITRIFTNFLIFNNKCRLTLFFKEFLIQDNSCEYLRHFYPKDKLKTILTKILEIYCLYSKIYPNYIILTENKFLYKNIRKKQKMIDEINQNCETNNKKITDKNNNKDNELFTPSVRNEIKEFQENSYTLKNNIDIISNKKINTENTKKINDNWILINNKKNNKNISNSKKNNNSQYNKNMSFDSFWTNDTNNLSTLLNAINDKIITTDNNQNNKDNKNKKKDINYRNNNLIFTKYKNQKRKEIKSTSKKSLKKVIYKKKDNKSLLSENSRNNNFLKIKNKKMYLNNMKTTKPLSSSLSNNSNMNLGQINKVNNIYNHLLTEKNIDKEIKKNIHQYYSIQRENSDKTVVNNLKKIIRPISMKEKFYSKEYSKDKKSIKKTETNHIIKNEKITEASNNNKCDHYIRKKSHPHEHLKIFLDNSKKIGSYDQSIKEENVKNGSFNTKILFNTNNNFNKLRNRGYFYKRYFTNNNYIQKPVNQRYVNYLTESNSQTLINSKKEKKINSSCNNFNKKKQQDEKSNDNKCKTLINCQTSTDYYISKNKNINYNTKNNYYNIEKHKTEGNILKKRDNILKREVCTAYIKKKCFSPLSNNYHRRYSLSKSYTIKKEKSINNKINDQLIQRQMINSRIKNKLIDIKKKIRKQIIQHGGSNKEKIYFNNKSINSNKDLFFDISQKDNSKNIIILDLKENIRKNKKIYPRKNFSPTLTHYNLYKSNSKNNSNNNSEFIEYHHENLFIKKSTINKISNNDSNISKSDNKENNVCINNLKINNINYKMIKSKTDNFKPKYKNINTNKNKEYINEINKNIILKRFQKKPNNFSMLSKGDINKNYNFNDIAFQRFNNLSNSTINNNSSLKEFTITKNVNNSLSNSMNNLTEFQTPFIQKKRLKLIKKFIYQEQKEKIGHISNIDNISSKIIIKVNRNKFLERVKEKMKNKILPPNLIIND